MAFKIPFTRIPKYMKMVYTPAKGTSGLKWSDISQRVAYSQCLQALSNKNPLPDRQGVVGMKLGGR